MNPKQIRNEKAARRIVAALKARHFDAYYCETKEEAAEKIMSLIPETDTVAWGGSATMVSLGVIERVLKRNPVINRDEAKTGDEKAELMRKSLLCDTYLTGTNALTEDGELVNVDGNGNRVAAMIYGPKRVIVATGMNKVTKTVQEAAARARNYAAPINAQRFGLKTPCSETGVCGDCKGKDSICSFIVRTRLCRPENRIIVVLIGEDLGF